MFSRLSNRDKSGIESRAFSTVSVYLKLDCAKIKNSYKRLNCGVICATQDPGSNYFRIETCYHESFPCGYSPSFSSLYHLI